MVCSCIRVRVAYVCSHGSAFLAIGIPVILFIKSSFGPQSYPTPLCFISVSHAPTYPANSPDACAFVLSLGRSH